MKIMVVMAMVTSARLGKEEREKQKAQGKYISGRSFLVW
jgi:hypothetical protein